MKVRIHRWLGLAIVPLTLIMLGASPAIAAGETHKCDGDPNFPFLNEVFTHDENSPINGPIIIRRTDGQDCTISAADIHATGQIDIRVENGGKLIFTDAVNIRSLGSDVKLVSTGNNVEAALANITADNLLLLEAGIEGGQQEPSTPGSITAKDVTSNTQDITIGDANILIRAQGGINIGKVKSNGTLGLNSQRSGNVQIDAYQSTELNGNVTIGTGGNIEEIDIRSLLGGTDQIGNPSPIFSEIGVRVTNGKTDSIGSITISDASAIKVQQGQSRAGRIELNANKGVLNFSTGGILDASGAGNYGGGNIYLIADSIVFNGSTTLNNGQSDSAPPTGRQIIIAASNIDYKNGAKLSILSNGDGYSNSVPATVYILPEGGLVSNSNNQLVSMIWTLQFNGSFFSYPGAVHFNGGTVADLEIIADGNKVQIAITGSDIDFDGRNVQIQTKGDHYQGKHEIVIGYFGTPTNNDGLTFNNSGTTELFVRGQGNSAAAGDIQIQTADKIVVNSAKFNLKANGPETFPGDGGTILVLTPDISLGSNTRAQFIADASKFGIGSAQILRNDRQAIHFDAGSGVIPVGKLDGQYSFSAKGGGAAGNGGAIEIFTTDVVRMRNQEKTVQLQAAGAAGDGGELYIEAKKVVFSQDDDNNNPVRRPIDASGGAVSGNGGIVIIPKTESKSTTEGINVPAVINVQGPISVGYDSGVVELNGVQCDQINTFFIQYPQRVWQCTGASHGIEMAQTVALQLPIQLTGQLGFVPTTPFSVQLFAMRDANDWVKFFDSKVSQLPNNSTNDLGGLSVVGQRHTTVFAYVLTADGEKTIETAINSLTAKKATTLHEIGHQFDFMWGNQSATGTFNLDMMSDFGHMVLTTDCDIHFTALACSDPDILNLDNNKQRWDALGFPVGATQFDRDEMFAFVFANLTCAGTCSDDPDLEKAIGVSFTPIGNPPPGDTGAFIRDLIMNPPFPQ